MAKPYRCPECINAAARCESCRARRRDAEAAQRAARREEGRCIACARKALPGLSRCKHHRDLNREHSRAGHQRARDAEDTVTEVTR